MITQLMRVIEKQEALISVQSEALNEISNLLAQHIGTREVERLPSLAKIKEIKDFRKG